MSMQGMRSRWNLIRSSKLIMRIVEFMDGLMMAVGKYGRLRLVRVHIQALFVMVLGLEKVWDIFGYGIEFFFN